MAEIVGIEGRTRAQLQAELNQGARFVFFTYVISLGIVTFRRSSAIIYKAPNESAWVKGLPYSLLSLLMGWWGIPFGFIYTPIALYSNFNGGVDVTDEVAAQVLQGGP
jgi:hypothetical protein